MAELVSAARIWAIEQAAIALGKVADPELMDRAGLGLVEAALAFGPRLFAEGWPKLLPQVF